MIFNQNIYYGFQKFYLQKHEPYSYLHSDLKWTLVVSDHHKQCLRFAYPELDIFRVFCGVDLEKFAFRPLNKKKRKIACNQKKKTTRYLIALSSSAIAF